MAADEDQLLHKVHGLGDLDLAALLSLIAREHCIVGTETAALDDLVAELCLVTSRTFGLESAVVDCTSHTTLDDLASAILVQQPPPPQPQSPQQRAISTSPLVPRSTATDSYFHQQHHHHTTSTTTTTTTTTSRHGNTSAGGPANNASSYGSQPQPSPLRTRSPIPAAAAASPGLGYSYGHHNYGSGGGAGGRKTPSTTPHIANVIIAKNLDAAPKAVQIQCLELLRTRRLFTRTSVQTAPKQFLFVAVLGGSRSTQTAAAGGRGGQGQSGPNSIAARLTPHLNDFFYIAHWHDPEDGFAHLEEDKEEEEDDGDGDGDENDSVQADTASFESAESVVRRSTAGTPRINFNNTPNPNPKGSHRRLRSTTITSNVIDTATLNSEDQQQQQQQQQRPPSPLLSEHDIATLALAACEVTVDIEILRYEMNVVSFLRLHRAVAVTGASASTSTSNGSVSISGRGGGGGGGVGSVTPTSTKHLEQLVRSLAALHGLAYATPALVGLAVRKVYLHRIRVLGGAGGGGGAERERSMQWGSDRAAVVALLDGVGAEEVIEDVLGLVDAPL